MDNLTLPSQLQTIQSYTIEVIVPDLEIPWGMAFLPDNSLLITEKEGQLIHFQNGQKTNIKMYPPPTFVDKVDSWGLRYTQIIKTTTPFILLNLHQ